MKRSLSVVVVLLGALAASGCLTMNASLPGTLRSDVSEGRIDKVGRFEKEVNHMFIPCGFGSAPSTAFRQALLEEAKARGADGVANVRFEAYSGCFDLLIMGATCTIVTPRTYKLSGDLVRIRKAPLPGKPPQAAPSTETKSSGEQIQVEASAPQGDTTLVAY